MSFTGAFTWLGGKSKLASKIIPYFPVHDCYCEPFFGAGAIFFAKEKARVNCINDLNGDIANFFRVVREETDEFCERLPFYPHSRDDFNYLKGLDVESLSPLDRALRFYSLIIYSFSGKMQSFGNRGNLRNSRPLRNLDSKNDKIINIAYQLDRVCIENKNFEYILKLYDGDKTLFYLDPPYYETAQYAVGTFPISGYEHIAHFMKTQKGKTALSINDHPFIRDLFKDFRIVEFPIKYSCKKGESTPRTELLVMNYEAK
jgi:DNA adenine methylase